MAGVSLRGSPERPLHEAVKEKPGLCWIPQDVTDVRVLGYLPKKAADQNQFAMWNQPKREKCAAVNRAKS